jgi:hypothetical protein
MNERERERVIPCSAQQTVEGEMNTDYKIHMDTERTHLRMGAVQK